MKVDCLAHPHPAFLFTAPPATEFYPLSLHDALPISRGSSGTPRDARSSPRSRSDSARSRSARSEEHTSELQSRGHLLCRLLLEKKNSTRPRPSPQHQRTLYARPAPDACPPSAPLCTS